MKRARAALGALLLALAACSSDQDVVPPTSNPAPTSEAAPMSEAAPTSDDDQSGVTVTAGEANLVEDDGRSFSIVEVGLGADGYVILSNFSGVPASLSGLHLCQGAECVALPDVEVTSGARAVVAMGASTGLDDEVATGLGLGLQPADGEVALFATENVQDAGNIRAYIEWGSTPHDGTATAIEAGIWQEGSFVESAENAKRIYRSPSNEWLSETG